MRSTNQDIKFNKPIDNNESGVLTALWRNIILQNELLPAMDYLIQKYLNSNKVVVDSIKRKTKSTLIANITSTGMTFKTFLDLIFNFLKAKNLTISVKLTFANGDETVHTINVDPNTTEKTPDEIEEKK